MFYYIKKRLSTQDLTLKETFSYSLGQFAIALGGLGSAQYLSFYWTDIALIPLTTVSIIMLSSRVFDGINDILIAWLVDRTKTKYGKARPWILWFFIPATIVNLALFYTPESNMTVKVIWAVVTYNLVNVLFSTCCMIPIHSLTSLITLNHNGRVTLSFAGQVAFVIAQIAGALTFVKGVQLFGGGSDGYFYYFAICAVIAGLAMFGTFWGTNEKVQPVKVSKRLSFVESLKIIVANKWWMIAMALQLFAFMLMTLQSVTLYYVTYIVGNLSMITVILGITFASQFIMPFLFKPIVGRLGKINATMLSLLVAAVGYVIPLIDLSSIALLVIASVLRGLGISGLSCTRFAIMADVVDYGEWKTNQRSDAIVFSGSSIAAKIGMGLTGMMITLILNASGYVGGAVSQIPSALSSIVFMFTWLNVIIIAVSLICLKTMQPLERQMETIQTELISRIS